MKKLTIVLMGMALAAGTLLNAQDLDKILKKHYKAIGQKKFLKVNTLHATGTIEIMGMEGQVDLKNQRPGKGRIEMDFQGSKVSQGYDGETAWMLNPMAGVTEPVEVSGMDAESIMEIGDMDGLLWDYMEKGNTIELVGTENLDGSDAYVLKLTKKSGNVATYFLDKESYLIRKVSATTVSNGMEVGVESLPSNYNKVEGYLFPYDVEMRSGGQTIWTIHFKDVSCNVDLDPSEFSMPD